MKSQGKPSARSLAVILAASVSSIALGATDQIRLKDHVPGGSIAKAMDLGRAPGQQKISLAIPLKPRNLAELEALILHLHTPGDPLYGKYITPDQFTARFAPTEAQYAAVVNYLQASGFSNIKKSRSRLLVNATAKVADSERVFQLEMHRYKAANGRAVFAPTAEPMVDTGVSKLIHGIVGLNNFATPKVRFVRLTGTGAKANAPGDGPVAGGLTAANVKDAYDLTNLPATGAGQTVALAEMDGYSPSDISTYATANGITNKLSLQNILLDGYDGTPTQGQNSGAVEVTLDIEMVVALAPAAKILVYQAPPPTSETSFETSEVDLYTRIANDNLAKSISTSWGSSEDQVQLATMNAENIAFMQMAAQGQSIFAASGDSGALDDGKTLSVDDPGSQPYMVSTGGTHLTVSTKSTFVRESSWSSTKDDSGGGGGVSQVWPIPSWQAGLGRSSNKGSATHRMVPDVSMDADPSSGYSIYYAGQWGPVGGTSCVAPLWAGFTALVNQTRATNGHPTIGFMNLPIYQIANSSLYSQTFNDVNDGSTNLYFPATNGYDLSTGWGSMKGTALFTALVSSALMN